MSSPRPSARIRSAAPSPRACQRDDVAHPRARAAIRRAPGTTRADAVAPRERIAQARASSRCGAACAGRAVVSAHRLVQTRGVGRAAEVLEQQREVEIALLGEQPQAAGDPHPDQARAQRVAEALAVGEVERQRQPGEHARQGDRGRVVSAHDPEIHARLIGKRRNGIEDEDAGRGEGRATLSGRAEAGSRPSGWLRAPPNRYAYAGFRPTTPGPVDPPQAGPITVRVPNGPRVWPRVSRAGAFCFSPRSSPPRPPHCRW